MNEQKIAKTFIDSMDDAFDLLLKHECILNVDAYFQMLRMRVCNAAYRNSYVIGANGTVYKCTMLLGNECNHIGIIDESGNMNLEYSKLAKWVLPESNLPEKCNECNQKVFVEICIVQRLVSLARKKIVVTRQTV